MFTWYKSFRKKQFIKDVLPERTQNAMSYHLDPYLPNDVNIGSNSEKIWTNASSESNNVIREILPELQSLLVMELSHSGILLTILTFPSLNCVNSLKMNLIFFRQIEVMNKKGRITKSMHVVQCRKSLRSFCLIPRSTEILLDSMHQSRILRIQRYGLKPNPVSVFRK